MDEGQPERASKLFRDALKQYERSLDPRLWGKEVGRNRSVPLANMGSVHLRIAELMEAGEKKNPKQIQRQLDLAAANYRSSLQEASSNPFALAGQGRTSAAQARCYQSQGKTAEAARSLAQAEVQLKAVVEQSPTFAVGWHYLADVSAQSGKPDEAKAQRQRAIQADPPLRAGLPPAGRHCGKGEPPSGRPLLPILPSRGVPCFSERFAGCFRAKTGGDLKPTAGADEAGREHSREQQDCGRPGFTETESEADKRQVAKRGGRPAVSDTGIHYGGSKATRPPEQ